MSKGVYAGTFDMPTLGHVWMIDNAFELFDELVVAIGVHPGKTPTYSIDQRLKWLNEIIQIFCLTPGISVTSYTNKYLVDFAAEIHASHIVRGIRNPTDYQYEHGMRNINSDMNQHIQTVFLIPPKELLDISSSMVRGLIGPEGWEEVIRRYLPTNVFEDIVKSRQGCI